MSSFDADDIRNYYDRHTPGFLAFGDGRGVGSIHRAVWGPGTTSRPEALHYVDDLMLGLTRRLLTGANTPLHVVDLGCGVGASLCYLAERVPVRATGITLSPVQARIAITRIHDAGLAHRVRCIEGDYTALPADMTQADLAYAIESFVHGTAPDRFFAECRRLLRPNGLLAICDDFRRSTTSPAAARAIDRFRLGWRINTLLHRDELLRLAHATGFTCESVTDLSPWLELHRLRDRAIAIPAAIVDGLDRGLRPVLGRDLSLSRRLTMRYGHLLGGNALQTCLAHGWIGYDFVVFRRG